MIIETSQVAERIITMKKMKQVVMRLFSTLLTWLGVSRVGMGPDGIGKILKNFCQSVNRARDAVMQSRKADREASQANTAGEISSPRFLITQQKARGTSVQSDSRPGSRALPVGLLSELSEKVSKATPVKSEEPKAVTKESAGSTEMSAQRTELATNPPETTTTQDNISVKVNCSNENEAKMKMESDMEGKRSGVLGGDRDIQMEATVEELDLLLADFTVKSRERRRRRLR